MIAGCDVYFIPELRSYLMGNREKIDWLHAILSEGEGRRSLVKFGSIRREEWEEIADHYPNIEFDFSSEHSQTPTIQYPVKTVIWAVISQEELMDITRKCGVAFWDRWIKVDWRYSPEEFIKQSTRPSTPNNTEIVTRIKEGFTKLHALQITSASRIHPKIREQYATKIAKVIKDKEVSFRFLTKAEQIPLQLALLRTLDTSIEPTEEEYDYPLQKIPFISRQDSGNIRKASSYYEKIFLVFLFDHGCISEDTSSLTISNYCKIMAEQLNITESTAHYHYSKLRKAEFIESKQVGRHSSKVWLTKKGFELIKDY
jgi:DNA-binding transcriptional ArsR family regulator